MQFPLFQLRRRALKNLEGAIVIMFFAGVLLWSGKWLPGAVFPCDPASILLMVFDYRFAGYGEIYSPGTVESFNIKSSKPMVKMIKPTEYMVIQMDFRFSVFSDFHSFGIANTPK